MVARAASMSSPGSTGVLGRCLDYLSGRFFGMLGFGLYGSRTEDRVVLVNRARTQLQPVQTQPGQAG